MERGRSMELDADLWSGFPLEIMERVLSFLPVPDLGRCRSVCKTWNGVIRSPDFGALLALTGAKRDASFIAMRCSLGRSMQTHGGWCFLDLGARRWFTIKDDLTPKLPRQIGEHVGLAVMDGGLVCTFLRSTRFSYQRLAAPSIDTEADQRFSIMVYNPIAKFLKVLPRVPAHLRASGYAMLNLVVDSISQKFKVFLINQSINGSPAAPVGLEIQNDPLMRIYDSATNEWQGTTNPFCVSSRGVGRILSTVMFQGLLYVLFGSYRGYLGGDLVTIGEELWRYNLVENAWERVNANIPYRLCTIKLFASASRLFMSGWFFDTEGLEVSEIKFPGMDRKRVFKMSKAEAMDRFDVKRSYVESSDIVASGFGNSILLVCKSSQTMIVFDLETRLWDRLPANPVWTHPGDESYYRFKPHFANPISHMNLILPSSLWWQEGEGAADQDQIESSRSYPEIIVLSD